jgi:cobalamin biosynthesis Mg chelatase CobN
VLIGYSDGCTGTCDAQQTAACDDAACDKGATGSTDHHASIARLTCGRGLVAAQDNATSCTGAGAVPAAAKPSSSAAGTTVTAVAPAAIGAPNTSGPVPGAAVPSLAALGVALGAGWWRRRRSG